MSNQSPDDRVHEQLARAVISGLLPDRAHEQAEKLLTRLETPVRLALMGMPQSGKSSLLNLLVGQNVLSDDFKLPTLELVYGDEERAICTLFDGTKKTLDTVDLAQVTAQSPAFVQLQMPLAALKKISLLEVAAPSDPNALHRASQWAAKRCDIALWCTGGFTEDEQRVWSQMPDSIKDHALLMLTRADLLQQQGTFDDIRANITAVATGEFNKILPIATRNAIAARAADGTVDKDMLRQSGGMALISAVLKQVDQGRRSALDLAEVLLLQNEAALADVDKVLAPHADEAAQDAAESVDAPAQEPELNEPEAAEVAPAEPEPTVDEVAEDVALDTPSEPEEEDVASAPPHDPAAAPEPAPAPEVADDPVSEPLNPEVIAKHPNPIMSPMRRRENVPASRLETPEPERVSVGIARLRNIAARRAEEGMQPTPVAELKPDTRAAYEKVVKHLEDQAAALMDRLEDLGEAAPANVMDQAVEDINWLCDYLNENGDDGDAALQRARDTAFDAADLVQLMQMEKRDSAAIEAVSLMLQLKRELKADLAA